MLQFKCINIRNDLSAFVEHDIGAVADDVLIFQHRLHILIITKPPITCVKQICSLNISFYTFNWKLLSYKQKLNVCIKSKMFFYTLIQNLSK